MLPAKTTMSPRGDGRRPPRRDSDDGGGGAGGHAPLGGSLLSHPMGGDVPQMRVRLHEAMQLHDPHASLMDLALNRTGLAREALREFRGRHGDTAAQMARGRADSRMLRSIIAASLLHTTGGAHRANGGQEMTDDDHALLAVMNRVSGGGQARADLQRAYGLDPHESHALIGYSVPNKDKPELSPGVVNPHYMGAHARWGAHGTGWNALGSAMGKIPSLGDLGVEMTTYRAPRGRDAPRRGEMEDIAQLPTETNVVHGQGVMGGGQRHYLSTAITYNSHWARAREVGGLVGITGSSGRYINPLGDQGMTDGAEILYPPGTISAYEGMNPQGIQEPGRPALPIAHFREVARPETGQGVVDDFNYGPGTARHARLDAAKMHIIATLEAHPDPDRVRDAMAEHGGGRALMYMTYDQLRNVHAAANR